ncbi:MAG: hypothetical protein ABEK12_03125, partial [Candidatus Nanohaloarchaea archaeon]
TMAEREDTIDTRIIDAGDRDVADVLIDAADQYDLTVLGASTDRSLVSRMISRPTAGQVGDRIDGPVIVVHSGAAVGGPVAWLRSVLP